MAVEKAKVIAALNAKLAGKNVTQKLKDNYATRWAERIATDDDIDAFIEDRYEDVMDAQREGDRRSAEKPKDKPAPDPKSDDAPEPADDPAVPPALKAFMATVAKQMEALTGTVQGIQTAHSQKTISERLTSDERTKGIPKAYYEGWSLPATDADFDAFADKLKGNYTAFATEHKLQGYGGDKPPAAPVIGQTPGGKVDGDLVKFAQGKNEAVTHKN